MSIEMTANLVLAQKAALDSQKIEASEDNLKRLRFNAARDPERAVDLLDFAARPGATLLDRSRALEDGAYYILHAVEDGKLVSDQVRGLYTEMLELAPDYFGPSATHRYAEDGETQFIRQHELDFWWEIATAEHADYQIEEPTRSQPNPTLDVLKHQTPELPVMLLTKLIGSENSTSINYLPTSVARDALELALDFRSPAFKQAIEQGSYGDKITTYARLGRVAQAGGIDHRAPIEFLYQSSSAERNEYAKTLNTLYESAQNLRDVFPTVLAETVTSGARELLANALFAVQTHLESSKQTHRAIPLKNGGELPVNFEADEPLEILRQLDAAFRKLHYAVASDASRTLSAAAGKGFQIDRFIDLETGAPSEVSLYTRPVEAIAYDDVYEYGRPGTGVEASISYRIQGGSNGQLAPLSKYDRAKEMLSIRLDREHDDVISLDIGSVLGNEDNFGTKIGRLLGWGNALRAAAVGKDAGLNHVKEALDQQYGQPAAFANLANQMWVWVESRRATSGELQAYLSAASAARVGRTAAVSTLELVDAK